ncbi:MAG: type I restriction-modification system subunit M [Abditibacteriota bacterium]|nr:type I restriction-modification system subunit M [Abditibacteriota bacterium]
MTDAPQDRTAIHNAIWSTADELRGSMDGWDFKNYVLGFMFYRFISRFFTDYVNKAQRAAGVADFDYARLDDDTAESGRYLARELGYFILPGELFDNVLKNTHVDQLNERLATVFRNIESSGEGEDSEEGFKGLFDNVNLQNNSLATSARERNEKLQTIMQKIAGMDLGSGDIDAFGDAYEFLMGMYASNAGKSGGEYFTPQQVSKLLALLAADGRDRLRYVYDPACGSGSLLLKLTGSGQSGDAVQVGAFCGQEVNPTTYDLCRMNMILHEVNFTDFHIIRGDTLATPCYDWKTRLGEGFEGFDAIVSNPPYSIKWKGKTNPLYADDPRFSPAGALAPVNYADLAFVMHMLYSLAEDGTAAIVCFPGIMYRGGAEKTIRKYLVEQNFVDAVIGLPDKLFYGTQIATDIMVLKKNRERRDILFIDASAECVPVTNGNLLSPDNIARIYGLYKDRQPAENLCSTVDPEAIKENDWNLSVSNYVEKPDTTEPVDIKALNASLAEIAARSQKLREEIDAIVREIEGE